MFQERKESNVPREKRIKSWKREKSCIIELVEKLRVIEVSAAIYKERRKGRG